MEIVDAAGADLAALLDRVSRGETILLSVGGVVVAELRARRVWTAADDEAFLAADAEILATFDPDIWPAER